MPDVSICVGTYLSYKYSSTGQIIDELEDAFEQQLNASHFSERRMHAYLRKISVIKTGGAKKINFVDSNLAVK